jgi:hypothetical protein
MTAAENHHGGVVSDDVMDGFISIHHGWEVDAR